MEEPSSKKSNGGITLSIWRKLPICFIVFLLVFSSFSGVVGHAEVSTLTNRVIDLDTAPPEIQSITVDKSPHYC
jgi:hypothetical protein